MEPFVKLKLLKPVKKLTIQDQTNKHIYILLRYWSATFLRTCLIGQALMRRPSRITGNVIE